MNAPGAKARFAEFTARMNTAAGFRLLLWLFAAVLFVFAAVPVLHGLRGHSIKDYALWFDTGQLVLRGQEIYPARNLKFDFMYPPPCALFLAPLSFFGKFPLILALVLVNGAAWIASILLAVRLATGQWRRQNIFLYLLPNLVVIVYVWSNFLLGQPSLVLLALMLGAFLLLQRNRRALAGALIAVGAAIKAFPFIAIIYLLYRRFWLAAASLVITLALLLVVFPTPFRGYALARNDLRKWTRGMLLKYDERGLAQRKGRSNSWRNQSVFGCANRILRHVDYDDRYGPHTPVFVNVADLKFSTVNAIIAGFALVLGSIFASVMPRRAHRTSETDAMEFALLVLLLLIFTPLSFGYLFAWLLYPFTVATQRLLVRPNAALRTFVLAAVALLSLTIPFRIVAQAYGNTFFATLLLFAGLAIELCRGKTRAQPGERGLPAPWTWNRDGRPRSIAEKASIVSCLRCMNVRRDNM